MPPNQMEPTNAGASDFMITERLIAAIAFTGSLPAAVAQLGLANRAVHYAKHHFYNRDEHAAAIGLQKGTERRRDSEAARWNVAHGPGSVEDDSEQVRWQLYTSAHQGQLERGCRGKMASQGGIHHRDHDKRPVVVRPRGPRGAPGSGKQQSVEHR